MRYERERPGELIHVDVKKIAAIPPGGGWRLHGRGNDTHHGHGGVGYRYIHTAPDDRTRLAYSETLNDEKAALAAAFWARAAAWFAANGITCGRVITDNGACYRSGLWHRACAATGPPSRTPDPAYIRAWTSKQEREHGDAGFTHFSNHHRPHGALTWATPHETLTRLAGDNLPAEHSSAVARSPRGESAETGVPEDVPRRGRQADIDPLRSASHRPCFRRATWRRSLRGARSSGRAAGSAGSVGPASTDAPPMPRVSRAPQVLEFSRRSRTPPCERPLGGPTSPFRW